MLRGALLVAVGLVLAVILLPRADRLIRRMGLESERIEAPSVDQAPDGAPGLELEIVTLLPFDAIPAILEPEFVSVEVADEELEDHNLVLGLSINDDHRAYSIPTLSAHEIVNDVVGGKPVAVTW